MTPLEGDGPWNARQVANATGIPLRTLQRWHISDVARASEQTRGGGARRYNRGALARVLLVRQIKRCCQVGSKRAGDVIDSVHEALQVARSRPIVLKADEPSSYSGDRVT